MRDPVEPRTGFPELSSSQCEPVISMVQEPVRPQAKRVMCLSHIFVNPVIRLLSSRAWACERLSFQNQSQPTVEIAGANISEPDDFWGPRLEIERA